MHVCLDKSSFVLGNELWEEHFESLLALVKAYGRKGYMAMLNVLNNPVLTLQLGILRILLGLMGRIVKGCVREVCLAQVSCILMCCSAHTSGYYMVSQSVVGCFESKSTFYCVGGSKKTWKERYYELAKMNLNVSNIENVFISTINFVIAEYRLVWSLFLSRCHYIILTSILCCHHFFICSVFF